MALQVKLWSQQKTKPQSEMADCEAGKNEGGLLSIDCRLPELSSLGRQSAGDLVITVTVDAGNFCQGCGYLHSHRASPPFGQ